jgi:Na+/H+ antiporter NhaD/arsenite permease-like protein
MAGLVIFGIPFEFVIFAATLIGVALLTNSTLQVALTGVAVVILYKLVFTGFDEGGGIPGFIGHLGHEWVILANLGLLLTGFALLSRHFEESKFPDTAPNILPSGWLGGLALLAFTAIISSFLDNIAAALIGATMARHVYKGRVHIGYLAAIVAASNAGGAGSVVGDTTTTMMWIAGKSPLDVLHAYVGAVAAFAIFGVAGALTQERYQPLVAQPGVRVVIDWTRIGIVAFILVAAIVANVTVNLTAPHLADQIPVIGLAVWAAIAISAFVRETDWKVLPGAAKGTLFLLSLVLAASLMPVKALPAPGWETAFGLGFVSAVFDNIPLTALALTQGGYDWGMLSYAVGFGGSMIWFGSSAGVAVSNLFPEAKSAIAWIRAGWWVAVAYVFGWFVALFTIGWRPEL